MTTARKPPGRPGAVPFELPIPFTKAPRQRAPRKSADVPPPVAVQPAPVTAPLATEPARPKRRRLAKAFDRPLDKVLMKDSIAAAAPAKKPKIATVRDRFTFPKVEHDRLVELKKQLAEQGVTVKKSDLIRVGLILSLSISPAKLKSVIAKLPPAG